MGTTIVCKDCDEETETDEKYPPPTCHACGSHDIKYDFNHREN